MILKKTMKLRSRKNSQKVGTIEHTAADYVDEDCVEPSLAEVNNDNGDNYTAGAKRKVKKKSRGGVEESRQKKVRKDKSQVSSQGCKRTLKDALTEKPEKMKLTRRIRQKRMKEVKTLLETPPEEIDPMKLSAAHLRLLQEAREHVNAKEIPSGPSFNTSFRPEDMDDLDYRDEEACNFSNDRIESNVQNLTKLNYHSYMDKQTRAKWSKSDTDLFYKQLIPSKTRRQVLAKFKSEEKRNPLQVHDAIVHRPVDNLYLKRVIKQLNIQDVLPEANNTHEQQGASNEGGPENEYAPDGFMNEEEDGSHWLDKKHGIQMFDAQEENVSRNDDDDLGNVFDWY